MPVDAEVGISPVHLVLGDEELLVERAISQIIASTRAGLSGSGNNLPINRLRAGEVSASELAELLSPSLFAEDRVVILEAAGEAGKDASALIADAVTAPPEGVVLVVVHSGGGRAKALATTVHKAGAQVHECMKLTKAAERVDFVRAEFRAAGVRVSPAVVAVVLEAVGSDLRELAATCSQLVSDTGGVVDEAAVHRYHNGKAEVTGFDVADKAVAGDRSAALEALRWATHRGVPQVLLADALADAVHTIARVGGATGNSYQLASELGMPPWKIDKAQKQARNWNSTKIAAAMQIVATVNGEVKGLAANADYALERAVLGIAKLAAQR